MQLRAVVCSALFAGANAVSAQAEVNARVWLLDHSGNPDELSDLKTENPDAYALVKALLTKRSLGLLDPKHPTASFAAPAPKNDDDQPTGAAVYAKFATTEKEQEALQGVTVSSSEPYPEASAQASVPYPEATPASKDWMSWKPHDSAADDDAMVKNVLGAVADLTKGKKLRGNADAGSDDSLAAETAAMAQAPEVTSQPVVTEQVEVPAVTTTTAQVVAQVAADNSLTAFTFDDSVTTTTTQAPQPAKAGSNPLASWLGLAKPHVQTAAPTEAKPANPYMMDLQ